MKNSTIESSIQEPEFIEVFGAREHNLKNISIKIPRNQLVVITGLSGSGKSSLAFDTIFAEGQRRYIESFSAYARQFLGNLSKPNVEKITGLSPVIAIEQKTTSKSPRSTVGTTTEIYDFLRLLFARIGEPYSYITGEKMVSYSSKEIVQLIQEKFSNQVITLLAPLVKSRKGHYRELFEKLAKQGYGKVRIDGEIVNLEKGLQVDRYKIHDIELVIDRITVVDTSDSRLKNSIEDTLKIGSGVIYIVDSKGKSFYYSQHLTCPTSGISYAIPEPNSFSFNSPYGACEVCKGLGVSFEFDAQKITPNTSLSLKKGAILPLGTWKNNYIFNRISELAIKHQQSIEEPFKNLSKEFVNDLIFGENDEDLTNGFEGVLSILAEQNEYEGGESKRLQYFMKEVICESCKGARLKKESLHFKIHNQNIATVSQMDILEFKNWLIEVPKTLKEQHQFIAKEILKEVLEKTDFLLDVGLYYLSLNRTAKTLSGGESQRIRLASQIGAKLVGVLYILDEPSIGLHPKDNRQLISALMQLKENGNSVIVVEHDKEIMEKADYIIDVGPFAGIHGGEIIDAGKFEELSNVNSLTYQYLKGIKKIQDKKNYRVGNGKTLSLLGASGHNLKKVNLEIPLGTLTAITGVSGSGKSSLIKGTLSPILFNHVYHSAQPPLPFEQIIGLEKIDKVIEIDQSPIGRTPRSNPATYTGVFTEIRNLFAAMPQAKIMGYKSGRFSFNVVGGRCEDCKGAGIKTIEMNFLPDVYVECKSCNGKRYNQETLKVKYKGKNISDVLEMPIQEALIFFEAQASITRKINALADVGLGYIKLGQASTTLSGGEAQRIKLASELYKKDTGNTFYILDEPTTGLHFEDIRILLEVLNKIVDKGNTVLVIEHNIDVIKTSDYVIDLGIEGGKNGGQIIATGTPIQVSKNKKSVTGLFLAEEFKIKSK